MSELVTLVAGPESLLTTPPFLCAAVRCAESSKNLKGNKKRGVLSMLKISFWSRIRVKRQQKGQTSYTGPRERKRGHPGTQLLADGAPGRGVRTRECQRRLLSPNRFPSFLSSPRKKVGISVLEEMHFKCFTAPGRSGCLMFVQASTQEESLPAEFTFK